jgi:hypothetical protein
MSSLMYALILSLFLCIAAITIAIALQEPLPSCDGVLTDDWQTISIHGSTWVIDGIQCVRSDLRR